jgi:tetratricopeptide (TPR) repeat protein
VHPKALPFIPNAHPAPLSAILILCPLGTPLGITIHMADRKKTSNHLVLAEAKAAESNGDNAGAVALYQQAVQNDPLEENAWQRLMVLHRKLKDTAGELKVINLALKAFDTHTKEVQQQWLLKNKKAAPLVKSLAKSLGLMNSKGIMIDNNPVLEKWKHRKELIMARLKKRPKK